MRLLVLICFLASGLVSCQAQSGEKTSGNMKHQNSEFKIINSEEEWKKELTDEQYFVLRQAGTERPFTGEYNLHFEDGMYRCAACDAALFSSESKFESHCGWPSFDRALGDSTVVERLDKSHGMIRTEILCASCGSHLGHVFNDGPTETGMRYCINSVSLDFDKEEK